MAKFTSSGLWNIAAFQSPPKFSYQGSPRRLRDAIASTTLSGTFFEIRTILPHSRGADRVPTRRRAARRQHGCTRDCHEHIDVWPALRIERVSGPAGAGQLSRRATSAAQ